MDTRKTCNFFGLWFFICCLLVDFCFCEGQGKPSVVKLTMGKGEKAVDLHNLVLTLQLQTKFNGLAAFFAALAILGQIGGV